MNQDTAITPKAIGYIRVSTEEQAQSGLSLSNQRRRIESQAMASALALVDVLEDAGESACSLQRPAMLDLMNRIATAQIDCVIVAKLDRLTRSIKDLAELLERLHRARRADGGQGIELISIGESLDTTTATGRLVINIMASVSQWEREVIAERTTAALQEKRRRGEATGGVAPFGFDFVNGRKVPRADEQEILQEIKQLRADGKSWQAVAAALTQTGRRTRTGGTFSRQGIHQIARKAGLN